MIPYPPTQLHYQYTFIPVGSVIAFAGLVQVDPPVADPGTQALYTTVTGSQGWLVCDGSLLLISDYGMLYAALGDLYKQTGDSDTTKFRAPDYRGYFLRMVDWGSPLQDPDLASRLMPDGSKGSGVGSIQEDALQNHVHAYSQPFTTATATPNQTGSVTSAPQQVDTGVPIDAPGETVPVKTSTETRPKNMYVYYLIKYM
jgi:microcystin-dependent protein